MVAVFAGRGKELARLDEVLTDRRARGLAIVGRPGIGKTRLVREALRRLPAVGYSTLEASGTAALSQVDFGALAELLPPEEPRTSPLAMLQSARTSLESRAGEQRLIIFVDDAHLLDGCSAALLVALAEANAACVIVAFRADAQLPRAVRKLVVDVVGVLEVPALSRTELAQLAGNLVGGPIDGLSLSKIEHLSEGIPRFAVELLAEAVASSAFVPRGDVWTLFGPVPINEKIRQLVREELGSISGDVLSMLEFVALGEPLSFSFVDDYGDLASIEALEKMDLVTVDWDGRRSSIRVTTPLVAHAIRSWLPATTARRVSGVLSDHSQAKGMRRRGDALALAQWQLAAGRPIDADSATRAATLALAARQSVLAEQLARVAWEQREDTESLIGLAHALAQQGRTAEAEELLTARQSRAVTDEDVVRLTLGRMRSLTYFGGRPQDAIDVGVRALNGIRDPAWKDELAAEVAVLAALIGDYARAVVVGSRAVNAPRASDRAAVGSLLVSTLGQVMLGHVEGLDASIELGLELAPRVADDVPIAGDVFAMHQQHARILAGRIEAAEEKSSAEYHRALQSGSLDVLGLWASHYACALLFRGKVADAVRIYDDAVSYLCHVDLLRALPVVRCWSALAVAQTGDAERSERILDAVDPEYLPGEFRLRALMDRARAWQLASQDELTKASELAAAAGRSLIEHSHRMWGILTLHDAVRFGHPELVRADLVTHVRDVDGQLAPTLARHAVASSERDGNALDSCTRSFETLGALLLAAETAHQAARAHRTVGNRAAAVKSARDADRLSTQCAGALTPALGGAVRILTRREHEVAAIAARGMTNRDIARMLHISIRTVENHLGAAYTKLGIHSRLELGDVIGSRYVVDGREGEAFGHSARVPAGPGTHVRDEDGRHDSLGQHAARRPQYVS